MKKRYLFLYGELNAGGGERVLVDVLKYFNFENTEVDLLQITGGGILRKEVPSQVDVLEVWHGYTLSYKIITRLLKIFGSSFLYRKALLRRLDGRKYDVAISFLEGTPLLAHSLILDIAQRNYSWVHSDIYTHPYEANIFRSGCELLAYKQMTKVICVAKATSKAFIKRFPDCTAPVEVIYNPINSRAVQQKATEKEIVNNIFTIVVSGRLSEQKKNDRVIRLASRLTIEGLPIKIQIVGNGEKMSLLQDLCEEYSVSQMVEFVGYQNNPFPFVGAADMLLSTSGSEGFSLVICEAMALGVPVVATKTAGPMEILDNDKYGLLCEHDDESIYQAVKRMYEDEDLRCHYADVGKERVKDFSVEKTMKAIYEL